MRNFVSTSDGPVRYKVQKQGKDKTRKKAILLQNDGGKERQEGYPTLDLYGAGVE